MINIVCCLLFVVCLLRAMCGSFLVRCELCRFGCRLTFVVRRVCGLLVVVGCLSFLLYSLFMRCLLMFVVVCCWLVVRC